jgi:hypothetical protein
MLLLSDDQVAELPRVSSVCSLPSVFIRNRSEVLTGYPSAWLRLLSKTIFFPSGDKAGKPSPSVLDVKRRGFGFVASGFIR